MRVSTKFGNRFAAVALFSLVGAVLAGCNGTVSRIGIPAASPWNQFGTAFSSPHDDLTVVTTGSDITADLVAAPGGPVGAVFASCNSDQGSFITGCDSAATCAADCVSNAPAGATGVSLGEIRYQYGLVIGLNRPDFTAGGVEIESASAGTVGAISVNMSASSGLSVGAGFSDGLIPGPAPADSPELEVFDDFGFLAMAPHWTDFGPGYVCADGTTTGCNPEDGPENVVASCTEGVVSEDGLLFRVNAAPGAYSLTCGTVPVSFDLNPPFSSAGECISTLKAQRCGGFNGQAKAACNHAQIGVCHATFNVPSSHNP